MKSKFFVIVAIIALVGFVVTLDYSDVWAQQEAPTWEELEEAKFIYPVEFSNLQDKEAEMGVPTPADWGLNGLDPLQVIYTEPKDAVGPPFPNNTFDFSDIETFEVDALANGLDAFFGDLIANRANLLVSFEGDPNYLGAVGPGGNPPVGPISVYMEDIAHPAAFQGPKWSKVHLVNDPNTVDDLDGLEVWGPYGSDDADYYSLLGDVTFGTSVWYWTHAPNVSIPYVPHADVVAAVIALGYTGLDDDVDLDALMVWDGNFNQVWDEPDTIIFSIRAANGWDGGEIVVLPFLGKPGSAFFLYHDSHLWDTAFPVAATFYLDPATEEVDAIEAVPVQPRQTPALTEWGLVILVALLIGSTVFIMLRRRKAAVPA